MLTIAAAAGLAWVSACTGRASRADIVSGFETGADLQRWSAQGTIEGRRIPLPAVPNEADAAAGPAGHGVRLTTPGRAGFFIKAGELPADLTRFDTLRFWVHRDPDAGPVPPSTIEVRFYEADGTAWFWRKIVLDHAGWKPVDVPFKWTRWSDSRVPQWPRVDRLGIYFRDQADLVLDRYWVAATLCRMLLEDQGLAGKMPRLVAAMQERGATALEPLLPILGLSWPELDARWRSFCRKTYGDG